jgi:hypothetical protein
MGEGTYRDREKFLAAVRERVGALMSGLPGRPEEVALEDGILFRYMGVSLEIRLADGTWRSRLEVPPVLPIHRAFLEERIERELRAIEA